MNAALTRAAPADSLPDMVGMSISAQFARNPRTPPSHKAADLPSASDSAIYHSSRVTSASTLATDRSDGPITIKLLIESGDYTHEVRPALAASVVGARFVDLGSCFFSDLVQLSFTGEF